MPRVSLPKMMDLRALVAHQDVAGRLCESVKGQLPLFMVGLIRPQLSVVTDELPGQRA